MGMEHMTSVVYGFLAPLTEENVTLLEGYAGSSYDDPEAESLWRVLELNNVEGVDITAYHTESLSRDIPEVIIVSLPGVGLENNDSTSWTTVTPTYLTGTPEVTPQFREVQELLGVETEGWILYSHVN